MWMCSEKSMKGLFHSHEATKSWRKRASPLPLCDLDSVITLRHPSTAPADLRPDKGSSWRTSCGSSITGSLSHTSRESGPSRLTSSFYPQAGRPADSAPGLGCAQAGRHLPKTMPLPPRLTRSIPHFTPLSEQLELLGGGPDVSTGGDEVQSLALTLTAATAWANPSRSELRFLICQMQVSIFVRLLCGSKQMLSTMPGTWWAPNNSNPKYIYREGPLQHDGEVGCQSKGS